MIPPKAMSLWQRSNYFGTAPTTDVPKGVCAKCQGFKRLDSRGNGRSAWSCRDHFDWLDRTVECDACGGTGFQR